MHFEHLEKSLQTTEFYRWKWIGCPKDFAGDSEAARSFFLHLIGNLNFRVFPNPFVVLPKSPKNMFLGAAKSGWERKERKPLEKQCKDKRAFLRRLWDDACFSLKLQREQSHCKSWVRLHCWSTKKSRHARKLWMPYFFNFYEGGNARLQKTVFFSRGSLSFFCDSDGQLDCWQNKHGTHLLDESSDFYRCFTQCTFCEHRVILGSHVERDRYSKPPLSVGMLVAQ